jgi:hypothetical protein
MSDENMQQSDAITTAGRRKWEGEHKIEIKATAPAWDSQITIDGKGLHDVKRIEIDIDCEKMQPIAKLTRVLRGDIAASLKGQTDELVMNALDLTAAEILVVDAVLESARKAANSEQLAVQLFAIDATEEGSDETVRMTLDALLRDAKRYRALTDAIGDERIWVYENGFKEDQYIVGSLGLEVLSEELIVEQRARERALRAQQT